MQPSGAPASACSVTLVAALAAHGVSEAVVCPGSRSAPLAYAFQQADRAGVLRLHVRVDERSAGFLALGLAKLSRRPVPVVVTSGTAVANLHPAVLEASHAGVPLLLLTADRPPELRGTGANQTTQQAGIFGGAVRWSHDLGTPADRDDPRVWRAVAARAVAASLGSLGSEAGPVHLDLPLREPLVPAGGSLLPPLQAEPPEPSPHVVTQPQGGASGPPLPDEPRTLLVLGDLPEPGQAAAAVALARERGWPVVAEPFGRFDRRDVVAHGSLLLTAVSWLEQHRPGRVLVVGRPTLSRAVSRLLRDGRSAVDVVTASPRWPDPAAAARAVYPWSSLAATSAAEGPATGSLGPVPSTSHPSTCAAERDPWLEQWRQAGAAVAAAAVPVVERSWPSGLAVAATLAVHLPAGATVFLGSSNPVRDLDLALPAGSPGSPSPDLTVVGNRGLAGIDGCVSTAVGIALSAPVAGRPAYALMGDLTFLHDTNGLLIGPDEPQPDLTLVVVNDDGGGIFTLLEPGEPDRAADFERVFGTPTGTSLERLCAAHGVGHILAQDPGTLAAAVAEPPSGLRVVEVRVDRGAHRDLHARLRAAAAGALG